MTRHLLLSIFLLTFSILCKGQLSFDSSKVRMKIIKSLEQFPNDNDSMLSKQIFGFDQKTNKVITNKELLELTNFPKAAVRIAALETLVYRHDVNVATLLTKNRSDTTTFILVQFECNQGYLTFFDRLLYFLKKGSGWAKYFNLSKKQNNVIAALREQRKLSIANYYIAIEN